jgi:hypothetical protein
VGNSPTILGKHVGCEDQLYALLGVFDKPPSPATKQMIQIQIVPKWRNVLWAELTEMAELVGIGPVSSITTHDQLVALIARSWVDKVSEHRAKQLEQKQLKSTLEQRAGSPTLQLGDKVVGRVGDKVLIERTFRFAVSPELIKVTRENADGTD